MLIHSSYIYPIDVSCITQFAVANTWDFVLNLPVLREQKLRRGSFANLFSPSFQEFISSFHNGERKKKQIKLTSQMRNYAKWDLLELNKCCVFPLTKYICLTQNETNFSAAYQTQQKKPKQNKKTQGLRKQKDLHKLNLGESLL